MSSVATVPTVYGIETLYNFLMCDFALPVATVPTVYGIETLTYLIPRISWIICRLQQYLPFTVLKRKVNSVGLHLIQLQQYLPFTVLKLHKHCILCLHCGKVATVLTVYGIETYNQ